MATRNGDATRRYFTIGFGLGYGEKILPTPKVDGGCGKA
jgi:hypothetical protein